LATKADTLARRAEEIGEPGRGDTQRARQFRAHEPPWLGFHPVPPRGVRSQDHA
jgi:hypothetical protein